MNIMSNTGNAYTNNYNKTNFKSVVTTEFVEKCVLPNQSKNYKRILTKVKKDLADTKKWDLRMQGYGEHQGYFGNRQDIDVLITNKECTKSPNAYRSYLVCSNSFEMQDKNKIRLSAVWTGRPRVNDPGFKNISDIVLVYKNEKTAAKHAKEISKLTENYFKTNKTDIHGQCQQIRENSLKHSAAFAKAFDEAKEVVDLGDAYSLYRSAR